ncbi:cysteine synthase family protein [Ignisphaera sp. 4213-co]|uniref:Cysteine synthase family protein n=1 Tax=Ignisphaera cupida TaxID=3050454 RepID=A0ABD4Z5D8_9CREN|nr:cysteine synthase family protein [Ignisphaera sp. 4213-co]MDK6028329.1 cysteine synthase family protein [Ignisphaera sp. 4213-co]
MNILRLIGNTPMVEIKNVKLDNNCKLFAKLEYFNPTGSHKDRIAVYMIRGAMKKYNLKPGDYIVEASSGNTAISVTFVAKRLGFKPVIVIPKSTSAAKIRILEMLGAEIVYGDEDPNSPNYYIKIAEKIAMERNGVFLNQYANPDNALAHYETTAREIWEQMKGEINAFVMGVGTGGTITGVGRYLKERKRDIKIVAVTPKGSKLAGGNGEDRIEGLLHKDVPQLLDKSIIDYIVEVSYREALNMALYLVKEEGILAGISSGANVVGAIKISKELPQGSKIVTVIADSIFRYIEELRYFQNTTSFR